MPRKKNESLLDSLSGDQARQVLRNLCASDAAARKRVLAAAHDVLASVDPEDIAAGALLDLEFLDADDAYAHAGATRDGYSTPDEVAADMFDEALRPHTENMDRYRRIGMVEQANRCLMGILKAIYSFEQEVDSEFKELATDVPGECFAFLLDQWWKQANRADRDEMIAFVSAQCPEWAERVTKKQTTQ